ncbi:MAG: metalloregulator ArsR/SmtB family transcription factor [Candidatus Eisenbacteria bacterium]|uniref:Metalloregulator ArsR/SmtB family transcription factor n=1 Tax=Eiseniibacteriota bacterium TaxID=2212470 RepID=A0A956M2U4_UNCEI|nr:metalloregulator ArsR/SmtB family transcription factor [Candidatus Eisenbacteria bacterium]
MTTQGSEKRLRPVWRALADPTRRAILDLLRDRPRTTGELAEAFPVSRFAVMKHLSLLVDAGLVVVRRQGRERWNHLNAVPLREIYERWVQPYQDHWASQAISIARHVEGDTSMAKTKQPTPAPATPPGGESRWLVIEHEVTIEAPPETVWRALTEDIGRWWRDGFYALGNARGMRLEPTLGGRMYEHADDGSAVVWFTVIAIQPGRSIDLAGHITVAFGGPTVALLRFEVEKTKSATRLKVSESRIGAVADAAAKETQNGWRLLLDEGLKPFVESAGSRKKRTKAK